MKRYPVWLVFARTTRHVCFAGRRFVIGIFLSFTFSPFCQPLLFSTFVVVTIASPLATTGLVFPYCRLSLNWITWFFIVQLHCVECRLYGPHPCCHLFDTSHFCLGIFFFCSVLLYFMVRFTGNQVVLPNCTIWRELTKDPFTPTSRTLESRWKRDVSLVSLLLGTFLHIRFTLLRYDDDHCCRSFLCSTPIDGTTRAITNCM